MSPVNQDPSPELNKNYTINFKPLEEQKTNSKGRVFSFGGKEPSKKMFSLTQQVLIYWNKSNESPERAIADINKQEKILEKRGNAIDHLKKNWKSVKSPVPLPKKELSLLEKFKSIFSFSKS